MATMLLHEERTLQCELRAEKVGSQPIIHGYAAVFGVRASIGGKFNETIEPGAFAESIRTDDVRALVNHIPSALIGRSKAGTLRMSEDSKGLAIEIDPPDTQVGRDLITSMRRGDLNEMSFGFIVRPDGQRTELHRDGMLRTITGVKLLDISVVTYPAYQETSASLRGVRSAEETLREIAGVTGEVNDLEWRKLQLEAMRANFALRANKPKTADEFAMLQNQIRKVAMLQL